MGVLEEGGMSTDKPKGGLLQKPLANKSVVDRVVDRLTGAILNGELHPGDKIPTELELAEAFEVGRNSVREAIKVLEAFGVLRIKRSEGTFVAGEFTKRMLDPMLYGLLLQRDSGTEIHDLRQVFDTGVLHVVVNKAGEEHLDDIRARLADLRKAAAMEPFSLEKLLDADVAFHESVVASAENALLSSIAGYVDRLTIPSRTETMRAIVASGQLGIFLNLHENMLDVLERKDENRIAETVRDHYQFWRRQITRYAG